MNTQRLLLSMISLLISTAPILSGDNTKSQPNDNEFVPQWAKSAIWYQIFPERFRDGDSSNNPTISDIKGADPMEAPKTWEIHPWGSDWYQLQDYELKNGEPERWKHVLRRRYGGDLQGVIDKLDYLQELGINAIYFNPLFDAPSLHKYDGASYHHIDPNFGPNPEGDRQLMATENPLDPRTWVWTSADLLALEMIKEAHRRGIRVIFDGVFNHMGINSFAFQDLLKNQENSPYKDWFIVHSFDDETKGTTFDYKGWYGAKSLPEFREDESGIVKGPKEYIFHATQRWMNPKNEGIENGIDGWRLDVAFCVAHPFWKDWRKHVKSINPEAYLTAEIVSDAEEVIPYLQGDEFDGEMNYNFSFNCAGFFFNPPHMQLSATEFDANLKSLRELYPQGVAYVNQNLFGSHDSNRIGSHIVNRGIGDFVQWGNYFQLSIPQNNPDYKVHKPGPEDIRLQKLFVLMQMTYVGAPMIYYGDEVGMWGGNDPDCRKPMIWDDLEYEDETWMLDGSQRKPDTVEVNHDLLEFYKQLIAIRKAHPALRLGSYETILVDDRAKLYGFLRQHNDEKVLVVFNNADEDQTINLDLKKYSVTSTTNLLSKEELELNESELTLSLPYKTGVVLRLR